MNIIKNSKIYFAFSGVLVTISLLGLMIFGLPLGLDFTGGSLLEIEYSQSRPSVDQIESSLADTEIGSVFVQPIGEKGIILRFQSVGEEKHQEILSKLNVSNSDVLDPESLNEESLSATDDNANQAIEKRFNSVGPIIGNELKQKTISALFIALIMIVVFIAWAFRKISEPIPSWKYGIIATIALFHDILITVGVFVFLGKFAHFEVNAPFVAALLTILGYSINDTIIIFDRIRENLKYHTKDFSETVNFSLNQSLLRSFYTSFTVILVLVALFLFGGDSIKDFSLALIIGVSVGTYSSIFLASPLLVALDRFNRNK